MTDYLSALPDAMTVQVVEGEIVVLGPDGVAISLTVEAAEESARRLKAAVEAARAGRKDPTD